MEFVKFSNCKSRKCLHNKQGFFSDIVSNLIEILNYFVLLSLTFSHIYWILSKILPLYEFVYLSKSKEKSFAISFLNYIFIIFFISLGFLSIQKRKLGLLTIYIVSLIAINLNFSFEFSSAISLGMFNQELEVANNIFITVFSILSFLISSSITLKYFSLAGYTRIIVDSCLLEEIIHEGKLKLDLLKIKINSLVIIMGLHKYIPFILFKKSDLYFMTEETYNKKEEIYKSECEENSENFINSRSTVDSETEPLK
jgi:hypothetical protein